MRFNTYIAIAVAQAFYGAEGLALSAIAAGFMIVLINLLCISAFSIWGKSGNSGIKPVIREIIDNPLIISCAIGWFLSLSNIGLPGISEDFLEIVGRAALLLGLLAQQLGGDTETMSSIITFQTILAFVVMPVIAYMLLQ